MQRINAYSRPDDRGGVIIDAEGMAVDLITVMKMEQRLTKEMFLKLMATTWDNVNVTIDMSNVKKDS